MEEIFLPNVRRNERVWLPVDYAGKETEFAYPAVYGAHSECFRAINEDSELRPAEGLELALLAYGAYHGKEREWDLVKCFVADCLRAPTRLLWIPKNSFEDKSLSGVLVEKDLQGLGLLDKMQIPDISDWKQNESGLYVSPDGNQTFVRRDKYKLGDHTADSFVKDGLVRSILTPKGAEIFARTAMDAKMIPFLRGRDVNEAKKPEQIVVLLYEDFPSALCLDCSLGNLVEKCYAFGVRKNSDSQVPRNNPTPLRQERERQRIPPRSPSIEDYSPAVPEDNTVAILG